MFPLICSQIGGDQTISQQISLTKREAQSFARDRIDTTGRISD
jgi:hypothetical protein